MPPCVNCSSSSRRLGCLLPAAPQVLPTRVQVGCPQSTCPAVRAGSRLGAGPSLLIIRFRDFHRRRVIHGAISTRAYTRPESRECSHRMTHGPTQATYLQVPGQHHPIPSLVHTFPQSQTHCNPATHAFHHVQVRNHQERPPHGFAPHALHLGSPHVCWRRRLWCLQARRLSRRRCLHQARGRRRGALHQARGEGQAPCHPREAEAAAGSHRGAHQAHRRGHQRGGRPGRAAAISASPIPTCS